MTRKPESRNDELYRKAKSNPCPKCGSDMTHVEFPNDADFEYWCPNCDYLIPKCDICGQRISAADECVRDKSKVEKPMPDCILDEVSYK
jgi:predicted RNA-binding Zn-ribbon protein involved in translation (DUF1610 family)